MEFEKVKEEHILQGIKDYKSKGLPNEFGPSSTYDIVYKGEKYPPKAIMAYANFHAEGKEIKAYFAGGLGTDCFNALEREGFVVEKKANKLVETYLKEFALVADDWFEAQDWFNGTFEFYTRFFNEDNLKKAEWDDFQELGNYIHAFKSMAIAKGNALGKPNLPIEEYRRIFSYIVSEKDPINVTINNLYKKYDGNAFLPYFSDSSISELIAYAYPNKYVVYNRRDVKALEILGINVPNVRAEKFGDKFSRYNQILNSVLEQYKSIVGQRTNTTIQLELDQFFSWLYETKKADKPIKELIQRYKVLIKSGGLDAEKYKWEFIRDFKGKPDLSNNIEDEIKSIKFGNLMYHLSVACLKQIANFDTANLKKEFTSIRDETVDLDQRILNFNKKTLKIYKKSGGENSHHQDERSMSVYLTLNDPSEYTFYKSSYYTKYCELLDLKVGKPKSKYSHYLELVKDLAEDYISKDKELVELLHTELGDLMEQDPSFLLVAQDILYQLVGNERDVSYWVFQGNLKIYDVVSALNEGNLKTWSVKAHKENIKIGDKIILWVSGIDSGCYALAEVTSDIFESLDNKEEQKYYTAASSNKPTNRVSIKITHNLASSPILKNRIAENSVFKEFKGGNQGTNFSSSKEEYEKLLSMCSDNEPKNYWVYSPGENAQYWDTFYKEGILGLGWNELGDISRFNDKDEIVKELQRLENTDGSKKNDATANWDFIQRVNIGDMFIVKKGRQELLGYGIVTSDYYYDPSRKDQHHIRKIDWKLKGNWPIDHSLSLKTLTIITGYSSELPEFEFYYQHLLSDMGVDVTRIKKEIMPINRILYGPPGTGKTYHLKEELFPLYTSKESAITRENYLSDFFKDSSWWMLLALVLYKEDKLKVADIANHEFFQAKLRTTSIANVTASIWSHLQTHTVLNCENVNTSRTASNLVFYKNEDSTWQLDENGKEQILDTLSETETLVDDFDSKKDLEIKRYEFVTFHQSYSYEDFIEGIKPVMEEESEGDIQYEIKDGIFKKLCQRAANDPSNSYAIFIDEINRGNVSSIFGELITLIEPDKRLNSENAMTATLPYSRSTFGVPRNVHIYGTMNTADRSVESLDTALRRRFTFEERMPNSKLLEDLKIDEVNLSTLLTVINNRIETLIDRDHTIGHAYLMGVKTMGDLELSFENKIIPLLQEYFYGDYGKIGLVLGEGFVKVEDKNDDVFSSFEYDGRESLTHTSYTLKSFKDGDFDFEEAIQQLFN